MHGRQPTYPWLGTGAQTITAGAWVEFAGDLVVPDCALASVEIWLEGPGGGVDLFVDHAPSAQTSSEHRRQRHVRVRHQRLVHLERRDLSATTEREHGGKSLLVTNRASNAPAATDLQRREGGEELSV